MQQAGKPVQQQSVKDVRRGHVAGMPALAHDRFAGVREGGVQFSGADGRHQQIVGGTDNLHGAANACRVAAKIGLLQGMQPAQQIGFALKVGQRQRVLGLQPRARAAIQSAG